MNPQIQEFLVRIQQLEAAIEQEAKSRRQQWQADFEEHKVRFEKEVLAQQKRFKAGLLGYVLTADWRHVLCVPFIYPVLLPMLLLDAFITLYQWVCFPFVWHPPGQTLGVFCVRPHAPGLFELAGKNQLRVLLVWQWPDGLWSGGGGVDRKILVPHQACPTQDAGTCALPRLCRLRRCTKLPR